MSDKLKKTLLGALVAIALAIAVSYGLISQQTADTIQDKTNQTLSDGQPAPPAAPSQSAPPAPAPQNPDPAAKPQ